MLCSIKLVWKFDYQTYPSISSFGFSDKCLHFSKRAVPLSESLVPRLSVKKHLSDRHFGDGSWKRDIAKRLWPKCSGPNDIKPFCRWFMNFRSKQERLFSASFSRLFYQTLQLCTKICKLRTNIFFSIWPWSICVTEMMRRPNVSRPNVFRPKDVEPNAFVNHSCSWQIIR